jgi:hypothetical protein
VKDVLAKSLGSANPINNARATMACLKQLKDVERAARARGKTPTDLLPWYYEHKDAPPEAPAAENETSDDQATESTKDNA